jgi:hypothetical protein
MHIVFVHFDYPRKNNKSMVYDGIDNKNIKISIVQRNKTQLVKGNHHFVKDEFDSDLKWWQNSETVNEYIGNLNPDMVYIFGLNLSLHYRWLKHFVSPKTILIGQHCGEGHWIQRNLWLQQSALRIVDGFVFTTINEANPWQKCADILELQPIFKIDNFQKNIFKIYESLLKNKFDFKK